MSMARFLGPAGLVLASVGLAVALSAHSRGGARRETTLSGREVHLSRAAGDGSAAWASLAWQPPRHDTAPGGWVGLRRLAELGVDTAAPAGGERPITRTATAFAVLELGGPAYEAVRAERLANTRAVPGWTPEMRDSAVAREEAALDRDSRLVLVDVGPDGDALAARYPDASRHLIVRAVVRAQVWYRGGGRVADTGQREPRTWSLGSDVQVEPSRMLLTGRDAAFAEAERYEYSWQPGPGVEVLVATGRGYVPWVAAVRPRVTEDVLRDTSAATAAPAAMSELPPLPEIREGEICPVNQTPGGPSLLDAPGEATPLRPDTNCAR